MGQIGYLFHLMFTYPILNALMELDHLLGDFGLSIIVLTCVVYLITFPLMRQQRKIARAKLALRPQIEEINKIHANDPLAGMAAQQALYKEHGITLVPPFLPTIIQGLIFTGLFFALNTVLRHTTITTINNIMYPFLVHFDKLPNLELAWFTIFNATWHISLGVPDHTGILPILTGLITFVQMRMAQPLNVSETREAMQQAALMMQWIMPVLVVGMTIFLAWQCAAGVALYRIVSLLLNIIQQYFISGWGSLWTLPATARSGNTAIVTTSRSASSHVLRTSNKARKRHSSRRRRHPRRDK